MRAFGVSFRGRTRQEERRILGFPATMFSGIAGGADTAWLHAVSHPFSSLRRWRRRRRDGPYVTDDVSPAMPPRRPR